MSKDSLNSIADGALAWGVSKFTVRRLADAGEIKTVYVGARRMIPASEIARVISLGAGKPRSRKGSKKATSARP